MTVTLKLSLQMCVVISLECCTGCMYDLGNTKMIIFSYSNKLSIIQCQVEEGTLIMQLE